ncbi:type II toxin-antitoxin system VapC family toxin [Sphingomonas tabacisoli]|uniref:Ribonuclease VapC n=1 Tax=Sphingomonas tabacisoli TaxID=2249466 RepID=A0ABW4I025_9SPHN
MRYLLDSNVIIAAIDGDIASLRERLAECDEDDLVTSAIAYAEVAHGSMKGKPPAIDILDAFLADIPVLPFDGGAAMAYASLPFERGSYDRLIAAHAISLGLTVVTRNERHFAGIPDLCVKNWTK